MMNCAKHIDYLNAMELMEIDNVPSLDNAKELLLGIDGFMDSNNKIAQIDEKMNLILNKEAMKKKIKMFSGLTIIIAIVIGISVLVVYFNSNAYKISKAKELVQDGKYQQARIILSEIKYDDSMSKTYEDIGDIWFKRKSYNDALEIYQKIDNKKKANDVKSKQAEIDIKKGDFDGAISIYDGMGEKEKVNDIQYKQLEQLILDNKFEKAVEIYNKFDKKDQAKEKFKYLRKKMAEYYVSLGQYDKAYQIHKNGEDKEEQKWVLASKAADYYKAKKYSSAIKIYKKIGAYEMVKQIKKEMAKQSK